MNKADQPRVVIDTRERRPYRFEGAVVRTLQTGDYSVVGLEDSVAIERKSKADAYVSLGRDRARFRRVAERLANLTFGAIVVEATVLDFVCPPPFSRLNPRVALNSLLSWSVQFRLPVFFAGDRRHGRALTYQLLLKSWREFGATDG